MTLAKALQVCRDYLQLDQEQGREYRPAIVYRNEWGSYSTERYRAGFTAIPTAQIVTFVDRPKEERI